MKSKRMGLGKAKVQHRQVTVARLRGIVARRQILSTGCLLAAFILLGAVISQGQAFVFWSNSVQYDDGFNPKSGSTIQWQNSAEYITYGNNPSIGFNGYPFVEVHNGDAGGVVNLWDDTGECLRIRCCGKSPQTTTSA
jgi:hypothetical protein